MKVILVKSFHSYSESCHLGTPLVHIVNLVIRTGEWPKEWKESLITPGLKKGKPRLQIGSYRPVALLCAVSKLTEQVLYNQLIDHVESSARIDDVRLSDQFFIYLIFSGMQTLKIIIQA